MPASDPETLTFYGQRAEVYAAETAAVPTRGLYHFLDALPAGARILELGCGSGRDSAHMLARGFNATPTDGSAEMAQQAERRLGRPVTVLPFDRLDALELYDGIWANACLLHVPRDELAGILMRIHQALKAGGLFHASFKAGTAEGRDGLGRYYNYPSEDWLAAQYTAAGWMVVRLEARNGAGYDGAPAVWLHVLATR